MLLRVCSERGMPLAHKTARRRRRQGCACNFLWACDHVPMTLSRPKAVSLFSSAGIGELGLLKNGIDIVLSNEIDERRHQLYAHNFPSTKCVQGDVRVHKGEILDYWRDSFPGEVPFLVYATPPCQGMSTNGVGRLGYGVRAGERSPTDERNRLIIPAMDIVTALQPRWVLLENVPGMAKTEIQDEDGKLVNILKYVERRLGGEYVGRGEVVACEDYGIPQTRRRLITIYTRVPGGIEYFNRNGFTFFPETWRKPRVTLREAIGQLPPLDAERGNDSRPDFHPLHYVPVMKPEKYWWISHTPEGDTAFNNQCVNPTCGFQGNERYRDVHENGGSRRRGDTPVHCSECGELLPRPSLVDRKTGDRRLIRGFHSAYRRMKWDVPATTLTQNFLYEASDNKVHPDQNRVLSIYEALILQTIAEYEYDFSPGGTRVPDPWIAEIIGESVPPRLIDMICAMMVEVSHVREG
jgi:DNA (cytosine-5)-methyltransferase 1